MAAEQEVLDFVADECVICQLSLRLSVDINNPIVAVVGTSHYLGRTESFVPTFRRYERCHVSIRWDHTRSDENVILRPCPFPLCNHRRHPNLALCFHSTCYSTLKRFLGQLTRQSPGPTIQEIWFWGRSRLWLSIPKPKQLQYNEVFRLVDVCCRDVSVLANTKSSTFELYRLFTSLPNELKQIIISQTNGCFFYAPWIVLKECNHFRFITSQISQRRSTTVDLESSTIVHIEKIYFDGRTYVASLTNKATSRSQTVKLPAEVVKVLLIIDDRGLVDIEFFDRFRSSKPRSSHPSLWYREIQRPNECTISQLRVITDGALVRDINTKEEPLRNPTFDKVVEWNVPQAPYIDVKHSYKTDDPTRRPRSTRMIWLPLRPMATGIIAAYGSKGIRALSVRYKSLNQTSVYDNQPAASAAENITWIYFPLSLDECLSAVWVRQPPLGQRFGLSLLFYTSRNRSCLLGPYLDSNSTPHHNFVSLNCGADSLVAGICYNDIGFEQEGVLDIGVSWRKSKHPQISHTPENPTFRHNPVESPETEWFVSSAPLIDVKFVQICKTLEVHDRKCLGLILHYEDYSKCIGQWRWDYDTSLIIPVYKESAYVHFGWNAISTAILDMEINASNENSSIDDLVWQSHPLAGQIVWWFNGSADIIYFEDL